MAFIADKKLARVAVGNEKRGGVEAVGWVFGQGEIEAFADIGSQREDQRNVSLEHQAIFLQGHLFRSQCNSRLAFGKAGLEQESANFGERPGLKMPEGIAGSDFLESRILFGLFDADVVGQQIAPGSGLDFWSRTANLADSVFLNTPGDPDGSCDQGNTVNDSQGKLKQPAIFSGWRLGVRGRDAQGQDKRRGVMQEQATTRICC